MNETSETKKSDELPIDTIKGLFNLTAEMMEKFGYKTPDDFIPPTGQHIRMLGETSGRTIMFDSETETKIENMMKSLKSVDNFKCDCCESNRTKYNTFEELEKQLKESANLAVANLEINL